VNRPLALITGGTSGIGLAAARRLQADYQLALIYGHDRQRAEQISQDVAPCFQADLAHPEQIAACFRLVQEHYQQPVQVLINAAGVAGPARFLLQRRDLGPLQEMMKVNYLGSLALIQRVLPEMVQHGVGVIVNIASASSLGANPGFIGYSESKAALRCLTRNLAAELAGSGVSVHCLSPARVATPMTTRWLEGATQVNHPLGRALEADEVAQAIEHLVRAGPLLNGLDLVLDGGQSLTHSSEILRERAESDDERLSSEVSARPK